MQTVEWHADQDFWLALGARTFTPQRWRAAQGEVAQLQAWCGVPPGAAVLDLACGPGRHALAWAALGYQVTALDSTPCLLEECAQRARQQGLQLRYLLQDMRQLQQENGFDVVCCLGSSFGYFTQPEDDLQVLRAVRRSLRPGGCFVLDVGGKEILARGFARRDWQELPDGRLLLQEHTVNEDWSWIDDRWLLQDGGVWREYRSGHRLYAAAELRALLLQAGFAKVQVSGDFAAAPYDQQAQRLVLLAR
jgi:SAM-dependent methyltransferase